MNIRWMDCFHIPVMAGRALAIMFYILGSIDTNVSDSSGLNSQKIKHIVVLREITFF